MGSRAGEGVDIKAEVLKNSGTFHIFSVSR